MARKPVDPTPEEIFLAPLVRLAHSDPPIEGLVFWSQGGWEADPTEVLDSEEIAFYAEGLIPEGFAIHWRIVALPGGTVPDHVRLYVTEDGSPLPDIPDWTVLSTASWPSA
ncbi:MAG: hypothetical protein IAE87_12225 [Rhodobacteraceae bacterium]|jgi:hypothetical protein|nr:hypothetical protein [Paracoccaceae bacterium]